MGSEINTVAKKLGLNAEFGKKIKHPYTFCSKSVGMLLLFYAIMMLRNTAFAASEAVTTLPSARRCSQPPPLTGEI